MILIFLQCHYPHQILHHPPPDRLHQILKADPPYQKREIWYGEEVGMNRLIQLMSKEKSKFDVCGESLCPSFFMGVEQIEENLTNLRAVTSR